MAQYVVLSIDRLDLGWVLAPERYDPRRRAPAGSLTVADLADPVNELVSANGPERLERCLVLDTGDAQEGFARSRCMPIPQHRLGSTKKRIRAGDVIVSRLRPYLRQVAYVDDGLGDENMVLLCSTEFFVLRGQDGRSIAFLAPFLLSEPVQQVLSLSQEGGHHPRISATALRTLPLPRDIDSVRDEASAAVLAAVQQARQADQAMRALAARFSRS